MSSTCCKNVTDFRNVVIVETVKFTATCDKWRKILLSSEETGKDIIAEDIVGDISVALGQAEQLKRERFSQFCGLIDDCEFKTGEKETTLQDLQGFWDIVYFQVADITRKFESLDVLRNNNWQISEPQLTFKVSKPAHSNGTKRCLGPKPKAKSSSALRAHMLAARNKMSKLNVSDTNEVSKSSNKSPLKQQSCNETTTESSIIQDKSAKESNKKASINAGNKENVPAEKGNKTESGKSSLKLSPQLSTFDAGFFKIQTPSKSKGVGKKPATTPTKSNGIPATTPVRNASASDNGETKLLSSTVLRERVLKTPMAHKDYSPCMRITRSMKKSVPQFSNQQQENGIVHLPLEEF